MPIALGPMSLGEILDRGLRIMLHRFTAFFGFTLLFLAPFQVVGYLVNLYVFESQSALQRGDFRPMLLMLGAGGAILVLNSVAQAMATAASLAVVAHEVLGRRIAFGAALGFALRRFLPVLFASLLVGLVTVAGCAACCVPGIMFMCWFAVTAPAVVVERAGPIEAMQRSLALTDGYRWTALALVAIQLALGLGLGMVINSAMLLTGELSFTQPRPPTVLTTTLAFLSNALVITYSIVVWSLFYFDLRIRKEGFDLTLLSQGKAE